MAHLALLCRPDVSLGTSKPPSLIFPTVNVACSISGQWLSMRWSKMCIYSRVSPPFLVDGFQCDPMKCEYMLSWCVEYSVQGRESWITRFFPLHKGLYFHCHLRKLDSESFVSYSFKCKHSTSFLVKNFTYLCSLPYSRRM